MLSRLLCQSSASPFRSQTVTIRNFATSTIQNARWGARPGYGQYSFKRVFEVPKEAVRPTLRERLLGPTTGKPFVYGTWALAGASVFGIGMLGYYGLRLSSESTVTDRSIMWPQYVRDRLHQTYGYLAGSLAATAGAGYYTARSPALLKLASTPTIAVFLGSLVLIIASGAVLRMIDYNNNKVGKHLAWLAHCGILGVVLAPMCMLGGPVLIRAAWYTAGVVAGLSTIAVCAPSEKFLYMTGPLAMGLGVVFMANIGTFFFPMNSALGASLASIVIYGGLILFSAFLLHDTQRVIKMAEGTHHQYMYGAEQQLSPRGFDPINAQLALYMDVLNIFIRLAMILGGNQRRK